MLTQWVRWWYSHSSSPVQRRLAEVMALETKAAAAAVLRSPVASSNNILSTGAGSGGRVLAAVGLVAVLCCSAMIIQHDLIQHKRLVYICQHAQCV